jgi:tetratricopeptide (TPR) repeat protein
LYIAYWLAGLEEEDFNITKGNYFADLEKYYSAIKCFKKALNESEMYSLYASIGWCYTAIDNDAEALKNYRKAYEKIKRHYVTVPLASLEMESGNIDNCKEVFENIKEERDELPEESQRLYDEVNEYLNKRETGN